MQFKAKTQNIFLTCTIFLLKYTFAKLKGDECEVCLKVVSDFQKIGAEQKASTEADYEKIIFNFCKTAKLRENRFCFYIGATEDAATRMVKELTKPLSYSYPKEKICENLKSKDSQICELMYEKQLDWATINLSKMKVKQLKKILGDWGEDCKNCLEKSEFIKRIESLKPKYVKSEL